MYRVPSAHRKLVKCGRPQQLTILLAHIKTPRWNSIVVDPLFKRSVAERVEQALAGISGDPAIPDQQDEPHNETETTSSVLEKSLRTIGIIGSIRFHYGGQMLTRMMERETRVTSTASRITHIRINGRGHTVAEVYYVITRLIHTHT